MPWTLPVCLSVLRVTFFFLVTVLFMDHLSLINSVLETLESYGLRPMHSLSETFEISPSHDSLTLCCRDGSLLCSIAVILDGGDTLRPLLLNCSGELSRGNRLFIPSEGGSVKLGRVISLNNTDVAGIRQELVDFLDTVEKDRQLLQDTASVSSGAETPSSDMSRELMFNLGSLV